MYIQRNKKMDQCFRVLGTWGILRVGPLPKNFIEYPSMRDNIPVTANTCVCQNSLDQIVILAVLTFSFIFWLFGNWADVAGILV